MITKFNLLLKLKVLKLLFNYNIKNSLSNKTIFYDFFYFFYMYNFLVSKNFSMINLNNFHNTFFLLKNYKFNQFFFFNFLNYNINYIELNSISNYNINFLFFYYKLNQLRFGKVDKNFMNTYNSNNLFFFKYFIIKYLNIYFKNKNLLLNIQQNKFDFSDLNYTYNILYAKAKRLMFLKTLKISLKSFLKFLLVVCYSKDTILFKNLIKYILESIHFKKHKSFLYNLKIIMNLVSTLLFKNLGISGLYVKIKGKIGVGGNLKKRKYSLRLGSFSFTKKNQKLSYNRDSIRTYSGVLGFEVYLTYF